MVVHQFYEPPLSPSKLISSQVVEDVQQISVPYGEIRWKDSYLEGIRIRHRQYAYKDHFLFEKINNQEIVSLQFNLKGRYTIHQMGQEYEVSSGQHNLIYSLGHDNTFTNKTLEAEAFSIDFSPELFRQMTENGNSSLKRFLEDMQAGGPVVLAPDSLWLTPELERAIHEVIHCRYTGGLKKLFLLSKSIEILVMQAEMHNQALNGLELYGKNKADTERIHHARTYLIEHIDSPPSLSELAHIVGINEFKLKKGFKEVFHTTVFGYLSNYRLEKAKEALFEQQKSISEIAYELGYSSPQHFSTAFKKKYGFPPRSLRL